MNGRSRNRGKMERLVARWRASGETLSGFARRHGVSRDKLQYWSQKLSSISSGRGGNGESALVPVQLLGGAEGREAALEIVLTGGERVLVRAALPVDLVQGVISALRERC